jgi:dTDP-glucose 4,6-dehydratase
VRSFIHIRDVADGTLRVARKGEIGEAYHFSTSRNTSIRQVVEMICGMMGAKFEDVVEVVDDRPGKDEAYLLESSKARSSLEWKSEIELEAGIQETIAWVRDNIDTLKQQRFDYVHKP